MPVDAGIFCCVETRHALSLPLEYKYDNLIFTDNPSFGKEIINQ